MEQNVSLTPSVVSDIKWAIEVAEQITSSEKLQVKEPPHFFCTHGDESVCARNVFKRKRDEVADIIPRYEKYLEHLKEVLEEHDTKKTKLDALKEELEKKDTKAEEPVAAAPVVPAPVAAAPVPSKPAAVPKGAANGAPGRR